MIAWRRLVVLLSLLLLVHAARDKAAKQKSDEDVQIHDIASDETLELSHEETGEDYSEEHDRNAISHEETHREDPDITAFKVCRPKKVDFCMCSKSDRRVDCRRQTRDKAADKLEVTPFQTAAITMGTTDFAPKYVYLTGNQIRFIDAETLLPGMHETVEGIDFGFNDIDFIDEGAFDKFVKLRKLRLNHNWIKINRSIDGWITTKLGKKLELLNLAYNSIKAINDGAFDPLHNLKRLILDGNTGLQLTDKTFSKDGLKNLDTLSLDNCGLDDLDAGVFKHLPKLKYISLINNQLTSLPAAALKPVVSLHTLDLSENDIAKVDRDAFKGYDNLVNLYMRSMSEITTYGNCSFCGLKALEHIDLSGSKRLKSIDADAFGFKSSPDDAPASLKSVKLNNCSLSTLDASMLPYDKLEGGVGLGGNVWACDDKLKWLLDDQKLHLFPGDIPKCASPPSMKGTPLQKAKAEAQSESSGTGSLIKTIFYMGISIGVVGSVVIGVLYANKRFNGNMISTLFSQRRPGGAGFNDLHSDVGMENEQHVFEDDEDFEARPAAV